MNPNHLVSVLVQVPFPADHLWTWLLQQIPVVVVLGVIVYFQYDAIRQYKKDLKEQSARHAESFKERSESHKALIESKDIRINDLADKALKVASLYDVKSDLNSREHSQILILIGEIRDLVRDLPKTNKD